MSDDLSTQVPGLPDASQVLQMARGQPRRLRDAFEVAANVKRDREREAFEESFEAFILRAWQEVDPEPIDLNWHHQVIAEHLVAVMEGEIRNLIINIPPRTGKTILTNVLWPAWVWCQPKDAWGPLSGPHVSFLCLCYAASLSEEIAVKMRRLVMGEWYQSLWGDRVRILPDQQNRTNFGNSAGGARISASIEGGILGKGGDVQIVDDPLTPKEANSQLERNRVLRDIREGLPTRLNNPKTAARILVMQRLHMDDPTSYALENWKPNVHLMFPMRFESRFPCAADLRGRLSSAELARQGRDTADGLLLWPRRHDERSVSALEVELGEYGTAGQLQQYPVPRGGGIVGEDDWQIWPEHAVSVDDLQDFGGTVALPLPEVSHVTVLLDCAQSEKESADYNACVVFGIWHRKRKPITYQRPIRLDGGQLLDPGEFSDDGEQPRVIMMGAWRVRAKLNDQSRDQFGNVRGVVQRVVDTARRFRADRIIIEDKSRGIDVRNEIARQIGEEEFKLQLFNPKKHGDKMARLSAVQPLFEQKLVYAPANVRLIRDRETGEAQVQVSEFAWVRAVVEEVSQVPRGAHDDYADCCFVAGTKIASRRGDVPIEDIRLNDQVFTPIGWRRVINCGPTRDAPVIEVIGLRGTGEHPVFSLEGGYQPLDSFPVGLTASRLSLCGLIRIILRSWSSSKVQPIASWAGNDATTYLRPQPTLAESVPKGFMSPSGKAPKGGGFPKDLRSTTKTATRLTVILATWSAYRRTRIAVYLKNTIQKKSARLWQRRGKPPSRGIAPRKAASGTEITSQRAFASQAPQRLTARLRSWINCALGAVGDFEANISLPVFAGSPAAQLARNTSEDGAAPCIHISRRETASPPNSSAHSAGIGFSHQGEPHGTAASGVGACARVYNLQVEEAECYYANGILVHNCSMGLLTLRGEGYLALTKEYLADQVRARMFRGNRNSIKEAYGV